MLSLKRMAGKAALAALLMGSVAQTSAATFVGDRTDFRDETIYFAITTRFYDGDPMNNVQCWDARENQTKNNDPCWRGDFAGLIKQLDYIKALGFTAIWITPVVQNASGFDYHGYHAMDFSKVDLRYESRTEWGSEKDVKFQDLIDAAHKKGIKIILDIVLQHTGNFGEDRLCHLFDRSQDIRNQANIEASLIPDQLLGGPSYWDLPNEGDKTQYSERFKYMKNTDGQNHDSKNYWHHVANSWNWDYPSRWWGQIAGDCVDLNTENPAVVDYLVECYGKFIEMGVDGFRIDTTGHIAPLTFNSAFIPRFIELGEKYKDKRVGGMPFYMFGECCARYSGVVYRDQHLLSSHYYTWKSDPKLVEEWKSFTADWWAEQVVPEGAAPLGNMLTCEKDPGTVHNSSNVFLKNGAWHEPDYSQASGFNVIDFPMHYCYNTAGDAVRIAKEGDHYYNDASWNVVYVDSHDYSPGPNDGIRFNGGTAQWAENLAMMFTFRGIPCLYYGSEVEFQKGKTIDEGPGLALKESGRAYYGHYLEGTVNATDYGVYTASGQVAKTLNGDLAQHIVRLNQIRAAVPALRKGQYTFDGCSAKGGWAFKRAYKDSYALVAINGGATFSNVPAGTYTDLVTGQTYTGGGSITVNAPTNQGQLRVLVKDWKGGKVGTDGKFIYATSPVAHGGNPTCTDPGTTQYYTYDDAVGQPSVTFTPAGGSFRTETLTVTAQLSDNAVSGWYQIQGKSKVNLSTSSAETFTIGAGMSFGQTISVSWGVKGQDGVEYTGSYTYKKVDPNASITVYVTGTSNPTLYSWGNDSNGIKVEPCGAWPGKTLSDTQTIDGREFYSFTFDDLESVNVIFTKDGGGQTPDITGIDQDTFFEYDGNGSAKKIEVNLTPVPTIKLNPNGGEFQNTQKVTLTMSNATSGWYKIGNGAQIPVSGNSATFTIGGDMSVGQSVVVSWSATNGKETRTGNATFTKVDHSSDIIYSVYLRNNNNWANPHVWIWNATDNFTGGSWPGKEMEKVTVEGEQLYRYTFTSTTQLSGLKVIFNDNGGTQTADLEFVNNRIYNCAGQGVGTVSGIQTTVMNVEPNDDEPVYFNMQGVRVDNPGPGIYLVKTGGKIIKTRVR